MSYCARCPFKVSEPFLFFLVLPQISVTKSEEERDDTVAQERREESDADPKSSRDKEPSTDEVQPKQEVRTTLGPVLRLEAAKLNNWKQLREIKVGLYEAYKHD